MNLNIWGDFQICISVPLKADVFKVVVIYEIAGLGQIKAP